MRKLKKVKVRKKSLKIWKFSKLSDPKTIAKFEAADFLAALQAASSHWFRGAIVKDWCKASQEEHHYRLLGESKGSKNIGIVAYLGCE